MTQIWALRSRLEKQPTDRRRRHHYLRDGTLGDPRYLRAELSIIEKLKWINATRTQRHPDRRALRHYVE